MHFIFNLLSVSLSLIENQNNLISRLATRRRLDIGEDWSQDVHFEEQSELRYSYHVVCDEHYHGDSCSDYCRPRDDPFGHYTCDAAGARMCLSGWKGEYCSECKCTEGLQRFLNDEGNSYCIFFTGCYSD